MAFKKIVISLLPKILIVLALVFSQNSENHDLNAIVEKEPSLAHFIANLKKPDLVYKKCAPCTPIGLEDETFIGHTNRYPPKGLYDKKVLDIGRFNYDVISVYEKNGQQKTQVGMIYFYYFSDAQKAAFVQFYLYYANLIGHGKLSPRATYIKNTAVIHVDFSF